MSIGGQGQAQAAALFFAAEIAIDLTKLRHRPSDFDLVHADPGIGDNEDVTEPSEPLFSHLLPEGPLVNRENAERIQSPHPPYE